MGLTSDGHGGWYDEKGEFVAKTSKGRLEFFNKGQRDGQDPPQSPEDKQLSQATSAEQDQAKQAKSAPAPAQAPEQQGAEAQAAPGPADVPKTKGTLTLAFGRFNPPTVGHQKLMDTVANSSDDGDYIIVPSRSEDKKKNPLNVDRKAEMMRQLYPDHADKIVNDPANRTIFDVMRQAHNDGYANIRIVGGGDRVKEYEKLANKYNGSTYQFDGIEVISAGERDPDSEGTEGMSASKMRKAAKDNDFRTFKTGLPESIDNETAMSIFTELQAAMGIKNTELAVAEDWEIAPRLYSQDLREEYISENIFNIGDIITHDSTGMVGEIARKGANHLICVSEDNKMFKAWTQDVSGGPGKSTPKEREVGTDSLRAFLQKLTPGEKVQSFINKNNK